jgi:hypothetical protein
MTLQTMSFLFGAILLAVAILGGGFEIKEIKVSNVTTSVRIIAGIVGAVFIALGFLEPTIPKSIPWGDDPVAAVHLRRRGDRVKRREFITLLGGAAAASTARRT